MHNITKLSVNSDIKSTAFGHFIGRLYIFYVHSSSRRFTKPSVQEYICKYRHGFYKVLHMGPYFALWPSDYTLPVAAPMPLRPPVFLQNYLKSFIIAKTCGNYLYHYWCDCLTYWMVPAKNVLTLLDIWVFRYDHSGVVTPAIGSCVRGTDCECSYFRSR